MRVELQELGEWAQKVGIFGVTPAERKMSKEAILKQIDAHYNRMAQLLKDATDTLGDRVREALDY